MIRAARWLLVGVVTYLVLAFAVTLIVMRSFKE